ncbi:MAG: RNA-directed DNA polymerase (Reverse transcriptase) [Candidatus Falkowbacteria bacterium GW2011_GWD2_38_42]|nr:MAG: RNA-directed DNA polymerase (Reverse transcriptase) [Candidatus Falkowbacteria bacterium GW2011_GWD2_38_42]
MKGGGGGGHNSRYQKSKCKIECNEIFEEIICLENLFAAWREFYKGKKQKKDVEEFSVNLEDNIFALHDDLKNGNYQHSQYASFFVCDPKLRHIHKACVRDRLLHNAIVRIVEPVFERIFIFDSYSSRKNKGTHKAIERFKKFAWALSQNNTKTVWVLKCDIRKYFNSVNHEILMNLLKKRIFDDKLIHLLENIIKSYNKEEEKGIPLGNLTSQLFSNVYLNELDDFIKRKLGFNHYTRYADDFLLVSKRKSELLAILEDIGKFLEDKLKLSLHPKKVIIQKWHQGVDFLGYKIFPHHILLRTKTKKRILMKMKIFKKKLISGNINKNNFEQSKNSYLGILKHCFGHKIECILKNN